MTCIAYKKLRFGADAQLTIEQAQLILAEYDAQNIRITTRALHYQFVSRGLQDNTQRLYKRLCTIMNRAKLAGLVSWKSLEDVTRGVEAVHSWSKPGLFMTETAFHAFKVDMWDNQMYRPYVLVEKDALVGVIADICRRLRVPYLSCRGYASGTALWELGQELQTHIANGQQPILFHIGDHDPSGLDMTGDNRERLSLFAEADIDVVRIALNMDQVRKFNPPPNFAKETDSRFESYRRQHGDKSWEADSLPPQELVRQIKSHVEDLIDENAWAEKSKEEAAFKAELRDVGRHWKSALKASRIK